MGYRHIKLHEIDPDVIRRARQVVGPDVPLMVDANCAWTADETAALGNVFSECNVLWVEEPVFPPDDYAGLARLEARGIVTGAGENASTCFDFERLIASVTYPQPSMTKVGGPSEFNQILRSCDAAGKVAMAHTPYFGPGYFATLAMLPVMSEHTLVEYLFVEPEAWIAATPQPNKHGMLGATNAAGIGFEPDLDVLERYSVHL